MRPVAVVQHEPSVPPGSITRVLERAGVEHFLVDAWREPAWPHANDIGALVVMGGTMNVDELDTYPFLQSSRALMADALERDLPVLGVCLGSQMMARVLGGDVYRAEPRNALFSELEIDEGAAGDPVIAPFRDGPRVLQFHEDTFTVPPGAQPLARSAATGLHQAFRYSDRAYAIQFHFEVDADIVRGWCRDIGAESMRADWGTTEEELLAQAERHIEPQSRAGEELVARFVNAAALVARA
jgi:GMP synthase (glutamine-hydrolysing)